MHYSWNGIFGKYFIPHLIVDFIISINKILVKYKNKIYGNIYNANKKYKKKSKNICHLLGFYTKEYPQKYVHWIKIVHYLSIFYTILMIKISRFFMGKVLIIFGILSKIVEK